ncbi:gamma-glutamylcyclotransferase [Albimonas sp. CAU 1670]|uniref:gamma-glutamylcyclotransferase n=1 Tax=Albimonas sp. CAU 1670 TaxID=3032599 RepID=UPI0023DC6E01|nr:gamma-glutamylcyclotransferase [Albimonas sp. CAU 1670]MDF2235177.1 gamma-glutamylcyclotransferase [Albimonas sp. CAU 1670]
MLGRDESGALWVFGYGSLIWNPGFPWAERRAARLSGFRRAFCLRSIRYRGTPEAPGLVLALAARQGAECRGLVYRVAPDHADDAHAYLREREMVTDAYHETVQELEVEGRAPVRALAYVIDEGHPQYTDLSPAGQAEVILRARGPAGSNRDYLHNTVAHLRDLGLPDPELEALDLRVRALAGEAQA